MTVTLVIPGEPKGKGRPRFKQGTKQVYTPSDTAAYEKQIKLLYRDKYGEVMFPNDVPLDMRVKAFMEVPESDGLKQRAQKLSGAIRPIKRPDWDNIGKIVSDALNNVAYHDDAQIVDTQIRKFYSDNPRVEITILHAGGKRHE